MHDYQAEFTGQFKVGKHVALQQTWGDTDLYAVAEVIKIGSTEVKVRVITEPNVDKVIRYRCSSWGRISAMGHESRGYYSRRYEAVDSFSKWANMKPTPIPDTEVKEYIGKVAKEYKKAKTRDAKQAREEKADSDKRHAEHVAKVDKHWKEQGKALWDEIARQIHEEHEHIDKDTDYWADIEFTSRRGELYRCKVLYRWATNDFHYDDEPKYHHTLAVSGFHNWGGEDGKWSSFSCSDSKATKLSDMMYSLCS